MNALYRPGPMAYIPQFIDRKHGKEPITYDIPVMEKYLKDTYGITVYQEQVMLLSRLLADFTRGESDALRKAMGKKKKDIVDAMKPKFIEGGKKNGHDPKILAGKNMERLGEFCFVRIQQVARCMLRVGFVPDGIPQGTLPCRIHGSQPYAQQGRYYRSHKIDERVQEYED